MAKKSKGERLGRQKESEIKKQKIELNLIKRTKVEIEQERNKAYKYLII